MRFDPSVYGAEVAAILALDGNGERLMPLVRGVCSSAEARRRLQADSVAQLFPRSRAGREALAGLWLYFSCWDEAHNIAQDLSSREASYWHAIAHRQEPDVWNAGYWFERVGVHPIFAALRERAKEIGMEVGPGWDPFAFVEICEKARSDPGSHLEQQALAVQRIEWQLLFDYCAAGAVD